MVLENFHQEKHQAANEGIEPVCFQEGGIIREDVRAVGAEHARPIRAYTRDRFGEFTLPFNLAVNSSRFLPFSADLVPTDSGIDFSYFRKSFYFRGGADRDRTDDLLHAMQALFQLSYGPKFPKET